MEDIREYFKKDVLASFNAHDEVKSKHGENCIPEDLFKKLLDEYMENDYQEDEKFILRGYMPKGTVYNREQAIAYAEAQNVDINSIVKDIGYGFVPLLPVYAFRAAVQKFGLPLWNLSEPWIIKRCDKTCPLGDYCNCQPEMIYTIADKRYCLGQLYMNRFWHSNSRLGLPEGSDSLAQVLEVSRVSQFELMFSCKARKGELFECGSSGYSGSVPVPFYHRNKNRYIGGNVIPFL